MVIQAKRYKHTVGVSAVRDLFGTVQNEGASKGILVTTSGYGKASFEFADGKPLELLSGSNLLYLLKEHAGVEARIVMPEDWKDPQIAPTNTNRNTPRRACSCRTRSSSPQTYATRANQSERRLQMATRCQGWTTVPLSIFEGRHVFAEIASHSVSSYVFPQWETRVVLPHVLADEKDYQELGSNFFDEHDRQAVQKAACSPLREAWV